MRLTGGNGSEKRRVWFSLLFLFRRVTAVDDLAPKGTSPI